MNEFQLKLFDDLMKLVAERDAFYHQDFVADGHQYRIYNYRLASYTEFLKPGALDCRGTMFQMDGETPVRLSSLPQQKFFNLGENPMTMDLDLSEVRFIELKADGSNISTYPHTLYNFDCTRVKSKGSLSSEQAIAATQWLWHPDQTGIYMTVHDLTCDGYTVNMEWCAPDNRIVIGYENAHLQILNCRNRETGELFHLEDLFEKYPRILKYWVPRESSDDSREFVENIPGMIGVEGYVVYLPSGPVKVKTDWYLSLHRLKDSINSPRRLFEAILDEAQDDLRASFHEDDLALKQIDEMEEYATGLFNEMVKTVEEYYETNKHLGRKEYAIKGQAELKKMHFGLVMQKYTGREPDYKTFLKKQWRTLGLKDVEKEDE